MISLIIPVTSNNKEYTNSIVKNIREIYPNENEVEVIVEINDNVTLGVNYNNAVSKAKGEKIILLHNDMVIKSGFIETMNKHISKNTITTYTRVEPPIFNDIYPGKVILDCGFNLNSFNKEKFNQFNIEESLIEGGSQLFFGCLKEDYIGIDGYTFKMFCEDDDLHLRYKLAGFEHKVSSAHVYHFVSKTSRATNDYQQVELYSNRNFVRKWGSRHPKVKYNIGFKVDNCNTEMLAILEPWCSTISSDANYAQWLEEEQKNTTLNMLDRVKPWNSGLYNDIIVEFDASKLTQQSFQIIQQLPEIIHESGEIGEFELDIFKIKIKSLNTYEKDLIFIRN
jgi:GT2 family glycosyltransferase